MTLPGFKTSTTTRSIILDAAVQLVFKRLEGKYPSRQLVDLAYISSGGTPPRSDSTFYGGNIPWAKISDITAVGKWVSDTEEQITQSAIEQSSAKLFPAGTVFFSMYGSIGKTSIATRPIATNQAILGLIPILDIDAEYLYYALINARAKLFSQSKGTSQKNINAQIVKKHEIPVPPLTEAKKIIEFLTLIEEGQNTDSLRDLPDYLREIRRIVARIEALAARVNEAKELRKEAVEKADSLFSSTVTNLPFYEISWDKVSTVLAKRRGSIHSGPFGSNLTHDEFVESGIAAIGTRDIQVNKFILGSGWFVTPERFELLKQYQIFPGDILVTIIGGSIGRFCVVPIDVPLAFTTKHVIAMQLNPKVANPQFMSYMLNFHRRCRETMFSQTAGSAQPSLNISKVKAIDVPIPPVEEQRRLVTYLDFLQGQIEALRQQQAQTEKELDALLPSILDKAFKGEL